MKLSLLTLTLLSSVRGNIWPRQENIVEVLHSSTGAPTVNVRANPPTLETSILPPRRDPIPLTPSSTSILDKKEKIEPSVVDGPTRAPSSPLIFSESRTSEFESSKGATRVMGVTDGNTNTLLIEGKDEIASASEDWSKKLFLSGTLNDELIVSRPGSGSVFIKGASRVAVIDDAENSVIVCRQPSTNLSPPLVPEENERKDGIDFDRKLSSIPPNVLVSESPKTPPSTDPPIELKDYLVPPYSSWQR